MATSWKHNGVCTIEITGAKETIRALRLVSDEGPKELRRSFRQSAQPLLRAAKSYAAALGGSGAYAASMAITTAGGGVRLRANDEGAGTIEFANRGAYALSGRRAGKPVGVPKGSPPRALVKSAIENEDLVVSNAEAALQEVIGRYF